MLVANGHQVTVFVPDDAVKADMISEADNIKVIRFAVNKTGMQHVLGQNAFISYEFAHTVGEYLQELPAPDIVEVQDYQGIGYYLHLYKQFGYEYFRDLTILTTLHVTAQLCLKINRDPIFQMPTFWLGEMEKFSILASDIILSPSNYILDKLEQEFRIRDKELTVVPNPIDVSGDLPDHTITRNDIVFFGKMVYLKGGFRLIEFFKTLWDQGFPHALKIIGDADFLLQSENMLARELILQKYKKYTDAGLLKLMGKLPSSAIKEHLAQAHVVVIPSFFDNLPYTVLEAMSQGKVILASRQGGQAEVIEDGKDGFLFDHNQPQTFFDQLNKVLALTNEEISAIGHQARNKIIHNYSYANIYEQKMRVINNYLERPPLKDQPFPYIRPVTLTVEPEKLSLNGKTKGLLSVVIPYYNLGELVLETVASIIASNYKKLEIIVVDDGSKTPESLKALDVLKAKFPSVQVVHKPNSGLADTRNFGANIATGEFLAFLDADDTVEPSYYEKAIRVLEKFDNIHFVGCWCRYFGANTGFWPSFMPEPPFFLIHNTMNSSALIFRTASFLQAKNDLNMTFQGLEDWECIVHMTSKGLTGASLPEPLFNYRVRKESMFRQISKSQTLFLHAYVTDKHQAFYSQYTAEIMNILNANGSGIKMDNPSMESFAGLSTRVIRKLKRIVTKNYLLKKFALKLKKLID